MFDFEFELGVVGDEGFLEVLVPGYDDASCLGFFGSHRFVAVFLELEEAVLFFELAASEPSECVVHHASMAGFPLFGLYVLDKGWGAYGCDGSGGGAQQSWGL